MAASRTRGEVEREIRETLGLVPSFFNSIPNDLLDFEWELFKRIQLSETLIPNKYKELLGLAVHTATKCRYCILFHTEAARMFGATEAEIQEAVHYAKTSLGWSAYLNGMQVDYDQFAEELARVKSFLTAKEQATV